MRQVGAVTPEILGTAVLRYLPILALAGAALALRLAGEAGAAALVGLAGLALCLGRTLPPPARLALAGALALLGAALWLHPGALWLLVGLLPALGMVLMAVHFGRTLLPGREPLITRYTRFDTGVVLAECARYARALTMVWTTVFLLCAPLYAFAMLRGEGSPIFMASGVFMLLLFLGEHVVRTLRFPHFGLATPLRTLRAVVAATVARYA